MRRANSSRKQLGAWKGLSIQPCPLAIVTSNIRTSRCIKSDVSERASADCHPEHHPSSTEISPSLCKAELLEILDTFYVCDHCLEVLRVLNSIRRTRSQAVSSWLVNTNSTRGCLFPQWCVVFFPRTTLPADRSLDTDDVSVFHCQISKWGHLDHVFDRQSSGRTIQTPVEPPTGPDPGEQALQCLISGTTTRDEFPSLIQAVSLSAKAIEMIGCLRGSEAQAFIDVINEVRCHTSPFVPQGTGRFDNVDLDRPWRAPTSCRTFEMTV